MGQGGARLAALATANELGLGALLVGAAWLGEVVVEIRADRDLACDGGAFVENERGDRTRSGRVNECVAR